MIFFFCEKCGATKLPVKNGQLIAHMSKSKPCDWGIPTDTQEGFDMPFLNNPSLGFYQNMMTMIEILEEE